MEILLQIKNKHGNYKDIRRDFESTRAMNAYIDKVEQNGSKVIGIHEVVKDMGIVLENDAMVQDLREMVASASIRLIDLNYLDKLLNEDTKYPVELQFTIAKKK